MSYLLEIYAHCQRTVKTRGVEWNSGKTFLVPIPDRDVDTLMALIAWIETGTTVIRLLAGIPGYASPQLPHYHSIFFVERSGARTDTIEST
jgi:hypothetical protein